MTDYQVYDQFKDKLPEITSDKDLSLSLHVNKPPVWNESVASEGEVIIESLYFDPRFPDGEGLLVTSYDGFLLFMKYVVEIELKKYNFTIECVNEKDSSSLFGLIKFVLKCETESLSGWILIALIKINGMIADVPIQRKRSTSWII